MVSQISSKSIRRYRQGLLAVAALFSIIVIFYPEADPLISLVVLSFIPIVIVISLFKREIFVLQEEEAPLTKVNLLYPFLLVSIALCLHGFAEYPDTNYSENSSLRGFLIFVALPPP